MGQFTVDGLEYGGHRARVAQRVGRASVSKGPEPDLKEPVGLRRAAAGDGTQKVAQARFACQAGD